jgi:hypothetical protein
MEPMVEFVWHRRVRQRRRPSALVIALSGWTDAGEAASTATSTVEALLGLEPYGHVDPDDLYDFTAVRPIVEIDETGVRSLQWGTLVLRGPGRPRSPAVFTLSGPEPQLRWKDLAAELVELAAQLAVDHVVTVGALLAGTPHTRPVGLVGYSTVPDLAHELDILPSQYEGPTGFLSVAQATLAASGVDVTSLWAEVPHYLAQFPAYPAAIALARAIATALDLPVDPGPELEPHLARTAKEIDEYVTQDPELLAYVGSLERSYEIDQHTRRSAERISREAQQYLRRFSAE